MTHELTNDAKEAIRGYFLKMLVVPGSILSVALFVLGYLVHDVANSKAESAAAKAYAEAIKDSSKSYAEAVKDSSNRIHELTVKATEAKKEAEVARVEVEAAKSEVEQAKARVTAVLAETESHNKQAEVLVEQINKNEQLSKSIGDQSAIADLVKDSLLKNKAFISEVKQWPDGNYCVISNGNCPSGFQKSEGFMRAISIYPDGDVNSYIKPSTPKLGDTFIQCHGPCRKYGQWTGELIISTCCK